MPVPARALDALREELFDPAVRKHELWLHRAQREVEQAYRQGLVDDAERCHLSGIIYALLGDAEAAIANGQRAVELHPLPLYVRNLAVTLSESGQEDEALGWLRTLEPSALGVHGLSVLASALAAVGEWREARATFEQARACAETDNLHHLWFLTSSAANVGRYGTSVELLARYFAIRAGAGLEVAEEDPVGFVRDAPNDWLKDLLLPPAVSEAIRRASLLRAAARAAAPPASSAPSSR